MIYTYTPDPRCSIGLQHGGIRDEATFHRDEHGAAITLDCDLP